MKFVLATHNPNKIREMGAILAQYDLKELIPREMGIPVAVARPGST